ncbi:MAG: Thiosulfate sulfurtransferase GlpE [Holosporales bacterium]
MKIINVEKLKQLKGDVLIVDVRETFERVSGHIEGDVHIPLGILTHNQLPQFNKPVVFYCRSGMRSITACQKILKDSPTMDVFSLQGGFIAWQESGNI